MLRSHTSVCGLRNSTRTTDSLRWLTPFRLAILTFWCCVKLDTLICFSMFTVRSFIFTLRSAACCHFRLPLLATVSLKGGCRRTSSTHTFGLRVSHQPEEPRDAREMYDPCAEVARDTCPNKKGTFHPFHHIETRVKLAPSWDPEWFYCGSSLTGHRYETSFPVQAQPEWETHSTKGVTWIRRNVPTFQPPCVV